MLPLTIKYFLVSSIMLLPAGCAATSTVRQTANVTPAESRLWTDELRDDENTNRYQVRIQVNENTISGICMLKKSDDGWRGTLMNEFGVKAFDFIVTPKKCELLNVISMLNKWYIRRTISGDLHFLIEIDNPDVSFQKKIARYEQDDTLMIEWMKKKSITRTPDNNLTMTNLKHKIVYLLIKLYE